MCPRDQVLLAPQGAQLQAVHRAAGRRVLDADLPTLPKLLPLDRGSDWTIRWGQAPVDAVNVHPGLNNCSTMALKLFVL